MLTCSYAQTPPHIILKKKKIWILCLTVPGHCAAASIQAVIMCLSCVYFVCVCACSAHGQRFPSPVTTPQRKGPRSRVQGQEVVCRTTLLWRGRERPRLCPAGRVSTVWTTQVCFRLIDVARCPTDKYVLILIRHDSGAHTTAVAFIKTFPADDVDGQ